MGTERDRIATVLRHAFDAALLERDTSSEAFDRILREIPSGLPRPDSAQLIKSASSALSLGRDKMIVAMIRLREFENGGIIPEDLKNPVQKESGRAEDRSRNDDHGVASPS